MDAAGFVGRNAELTELLRQLEQGLARQGSVCFVTGEPGAGKSSLLGEFAARAQAAEPKLLTAIGKCSAYGGVGDAYLPFKEILRQLTGDLDQGASDRRSTSESASRLRNFMHFARETLYENGPDLVDLFVPGGGLLTKIGGKAAGRLRAGDRGRPRDRTATSEIRPENVFEQYTQVLEAMAASRPLLLVLDDLHWADSGTLALLFHLAQRLFNDPVLIVGAYRRGDLSASTAGVPHPLFNLVAELQRLQGSIEVDLDRSNTRGFVDALLDRAGNNLDAVFREALTRHTNGNALFVVELLRSLEQSGVLERDAHDRLTQRAQVTWGVLPSRVAGVIESRLSRLTHNERQILSAAAVQGEEFEADVIAHMTGENRRAIVTVLSGALLHEHHLVSPIGLRAVGESMFATYRFRHNVVQDYLYRRLDPVECSELHAATADAIEKLHGDAAASSAPVLALHFERAGLPARALVWRLRSAETAALSCAPSQSVAEYEAALGLQTRHALPWPVAVPDRPSVLERLGEQLLLVGRYDEALERLRACLDETNATVLDDNGCSRIWRRIAEAYERADRYDEALTALDRAQVALGPEPSGCADTWWHSWIEAELARSGIHYWRNDPVQMATSEQRLERVVEQCGDPLQRNRFHYESVRQSLRRTRYRPDAAILARARLAVTGLDERATRAHEGELWFGFGFANLWADALPDAKAGIERSLAIAHRIGSVMLKGRCLTYLGLVHRRLGHDAEVARINEEAREFIARSGAANYAGMISAQDAWLAWRRHDSPSALGHVERAISTWRAKSPGYPVQWPAWWLRVALAMESADPIAAVAAMSAIVAPTQARPPDDIEDALRELLAAHDANANLPLADVQRAVELARARGFL